MAPLWGTLFQICRLIMKRFPPCWHGLSFMGPSGSAYIRMRNTQAQTSKAISRYFLQADSYWCTKMWNTVRNSKNNCKQSKRPPARDWLNKLGIVIKSGTLSSFQRPRPRQRLPRRGSRYRSRCRIGTSYKSRQTPPSKCGYVNVHTGCFRHQTLRAQSLEITNFSWA